MCVQFTLIYFWPYFIFLWLNEFTIRVSTNLCCILLVSKGLIDNISSLMHYFLYKFLLFFILTLCSLETHKWVLWQKVKTQMKWGSMGHFIRVCTVCQDRIDRFRETNTKLFGNYNHLPQFQYIVDHRGLTVSNFMENSIHLQRVEICKVLS